jgi:hypothetical protein
MNSTTGNSEWTVPTTYRVVIQGATWDRVIQPSGQE